ncbi:CaiB/BaiF CoA transferase family protein [Nocardioides marmorisolisilvae]|uniref:CoA transferase n=1 Tax=Nocardioides marmorisolisilvae TaxID=1542737 RepID=A0A3N0DZY8_9ACTN|nr:CaiB/BaiF CoA-transferase family protein [Nocardioides marmorisolisilvae]RNL81120.1 CoA transferase [Nocardioides marmorisolisilvae]
MSGPLAGVRVLEIASLAPAPFGTMLLADLGADVLRVDRAGSSAAITPPPGPLDRGKRSLALDLKSPEGLASVKELAADADVFVEGFRPGVAERIGIGPDELCVLNPRLIYARMTGWGQEGPLAPTAGHDINYIALAGLLEPIARRGERPLPPSNLLGDFAGGGMLMALGILAALVERNTSGQGQVIDAAMVDGASTFSAFMRGMHAVGLWNEEPGTNALDGAAAFYDTYPCADGKYVAVGCVEPQFFAELVEKLGLDEPDLPFQLDPTGWDDWRAVIGKAFLARSRDEWTAHFDGSDACVTPVLTPWEAHLHPHAVARASFVEVDGVVQPAPAPRFSRTPAGTPRAHSPSTGGTPGGTHWVR